MEDPSREEEFKMHRIALKNYLKVKYGYKSCSIIKKDLGFKLEWAISKENKLSIIIPTKDNLQVLKSCINSISNYSSLNNYEIILVNNNSEESKTLSFFREFIKESSKSKIHKLLHFKEDFNYSKINNFAINHAQGSVILFLNNDVEFLKKGWDIDLMSNALRDDIGFVGIKLLYPNFTIQHSGI